LTGTVHFLSSASQFAVVSDTALQDQPHPGLAAEGALQRCGAPLKADRVGGEGWREEELGVAVGRGEAARGESLARQILAVVFDTRAEAFLVTNAAVTASPFLIRMGRRDDAMRMLEKSFEMGVAPPTTCCSVTQAYSHFMATPDSPRCSPLHRPAP
jgi:hypothetical protein